MDILKIVEQFGIPVAMTIAFGYYIWKQNQFIQKTLMQELDQDFKRLEGIIIKLIDQQKKVHSGKFIFSQSSMKTVMESLEGRIVESREISRYI